jgi:hypothetical protein
MKFENSQSIGRTGLILALVLAISMTVRAADPDPDFKKTCFRGLVETYSMEGLDKPEQLGLKMCGNVRNTCCQIKDQETMFTNWVHGKEEENIEEHYSRNTKVYQELINQLVEVQKYASQVKGVIVKKVSNCKLLAERILNHEVSQVEKKIIENLENLKKFFILSYKGFYCTICNHDNHRFFKKDSSTLIFSEKFCRDIVEQTLPSLLTFHVDVIKLLNLVTKFVTSCDMKGEYNLESTFPKDLVFGQSKQVTDSLRACRDNRNKKEWFSYCKEVCMNFQLVKFSKYFEPNVEEMNKYNAFLKKSNQDLALEKAMHPLLAGGSGASSTPATPKSVRILEQSKDKKANDLVYRPGLSPKVQLDSWKKDFAPDGISPADEGDSSSITESSFNSVKTELQLAREGSSTQASATLTSVEKEMLKKAGKRQLSKASVLQAVIAAIVLLAFNW